ncbi:uncharacterized protein si:dkey-52l18.4 [Scomber scombrus]|uniref:Uncharacterized protein si:dkey-52l18.4 n=1 Tax=Scomber scombrus TaxID=13677 RepID=A0AAV1P9Q7_SCOSC|nr:uncharacterized protein si:dkey-52l18.4 [Scomber scombrus]
MSQTDMYLLVAIGCLCFLPSGFHAEECIEDVLAKRETLYAPAGGSLSLFCVVQHCGHNWTGEWVWRNLTDEKSRVVKDGDRYRLTNVSLSANQTKMLLTFLIVNKVDEGSYGCKVSWDQLGTALGHGTYLNITAPVPSQRNVLYRILIYAGAVCCLPIILLLARCLSSEIQPKPCPRTVFRHATQYTAVYRARPHLAPQPPPRRPVPQKRSTSSHKAPAKPQQKIEVVYADISKDALKQEQASREPTQSTVYSALRFP